MSLPRFLSGLTIAAVMAGGLMSASPAKAQDLIDFLWGGSPEYGGGRKIVSFDPQYKPGQVIVSFSDRRLYWITKQGEAMTYPVAVPKEGARWQGVTTVTNKRVNPSWTPTPSMIRDNPRLPRWVPGGHPMNPLGIRAMYLGSSTYRIHGTDAPWTIGQAVSAGCIRMTNEDVLDLYPRVPVGTRVTVTWQQFTTRPIASSDKYPRYGDADSNPRAASSASASASSPAASSSSSGSTYEYGAYSRKPSTRTSANQSSGGGLESLFFFSDEKPKKTASASQTAAPSGAQDDVSRDATKEYDEDQTLEPQPFAKQQAPAEATQQASEQAAPQQKDAEKAPKHKAAAAKPEAASEGQPAAAPKKKAADTTGTKKKTASASHPEPLADPVISPAVAVPDPVKPDEAAATKASASGDDALPVHKAAAVQVQ